MSASSPVSWRATAIKHRMSMIVLHFSLFNSLMTSMTCAYLGIAYDFACPPNVAIGGETEASTRKLVAAASAPEYASSICTEFQKGN